MATTRPRPRSVEPKLYRIYRLLPNGREKKTDRLLMAGEVETYLNAANSLGPACVARPVYIIG